MLYPVYVHLGDVNHAHGVTIPDFPGCFSAADDWQELPAKVQEAVEVYCEGEDMVVPAPTPLEILARKREYRGGVWLMVDIDLKRVQPRAIRINISLPESLVKRIDEYAGKQHLSRSGFLAKAAEKVMSE